MATVTLVTLVLVFFLFAASSALTYLSIRSWLHFATHARTRRRWNDTHSGHALRSAGFACMMLAGLLATVSSNPLRSLDISSLMRIVGYVVVLIGTPRRLRRKPIVNLAFILMVLGEALLFCSGAVPPDQTTALTVHIEAMFAFAAMVGGLWVIGHVYTRTVLRVRLTDKVTLAFSTFSLALLVLVTVSVYGVVHVTITDTVPDSEAVRQVTLALDQNLSQPLIALFLVIVAASAITSFFVARSLLAPVNRIALALRTIGRGELDFRLHGIRSRDEMQDLAIELNDMARRLKAADTLRAEFVSFASHELRNPLTAVKGFIDTLAMLDTPEAEGISQDERHEMYEIVRGECDRLLRMTNELLDNSRVEAGMPVALHAQTFDVRRRMEKVAGVMRQHTDRHDLRVHGPDGAVTIEADPDKFEQILINLISNSIKYSPNGGPIDIRLEDRGTSIDVSVADEGVGMTSEQAERVFDKFYRIAETSGHNPAASAEGTGIGLYLTRALVNAHGGAIRVKSTPGEGSIFTVTLPKKPSSADDPKLRATAASAAAAR
ncbi:MAG: ATP-binding protein [Capsulimonadaceae bacterium]